MTDFRLKKKVFLAQARKTDKIEFILQIPEFDEKRLFIYYLELCCAEIWKFLA